ncbi:hypothetical protein CHGG_04396 [Chaetomium globosum CBS 148.51]|uniref:F-box domain-containing protein n=1 Tax=Chaetomium globosum (strain ATCC 6205 / CBS 148.51 / DSM 1962 / NBRC 6347 / NRRL 1970) TaxID=306901 RepID=Q2H1F0_CHAGB|nr:uncharacterized protein CHGG_04396 [Chaetomium globosum CBS 148.51]EAQ87777.1 hypothetical protein CHGG_04396 [Chaetomium globosum CBS 148.51]
MENSQTFDSLPNELLISILSQLPTSSLLPLITTSRRIYSIALRILKQRLSHATSQPDQRLMLECYHPSEKLYTPYLYCNYLRTDSFASAEPTARGTSGTGGLAGIYAHFRPVEQDEDRPRRATRGFRRHLTPTPTTTATPNNEEPRPSTDVYLDDDESFTQLCAVTNLVRMGPKPGLFRSHVNVSEGVLRVWRDWLAERAAAGGRRGERAGREAGEAGQGQEEEEEEEEGGGGGGDGGGGDEGEGEGGDEDGVLWADASRDVGVRFRVAEKDIRGQHPVLVASDEQLPVAYRLEFGELLVRATTLLLMVEKSEMQDFAAEGKAIVLASF